MQTEKMSSLGQMVAGIAHEINTPLAYVKSSLATLKERLPQVEGVVAESTKLMGLLERGDATDEQLSEQFTRVSTLAAQLPGRGRWRRTWSRSTATPCTASSRSRRSS